MERPLINSIFMGLLFEKICLIALINRVKDKKHYITLLILVYILQVFHVCHRDGRQDSFLCPNGTVFNQKYFVCDWWYNFPCEDAPFFYPVNAVLGHPGVPLHRNKFESDIVRKGRYYNAMPHKYDYHGQLMAHGGIIPNGHHSYLAQHLSGHGSYNSPQYHQSSVYKRNLAHALNSKTISNQLINNKPQVLSQHKHQFAINPSPAPIVSIDSSQILKHPLQEHAVSPIHITISTPAPHESPTPIVLQHPSKAPHSHSGAPPVHLSTHAPPYHTNGHIIHHQSPPTILHNLNPITQKPVLQKT